MKNKMTEKECDKCGIIKKTDSKHCQFCCKPYDVKSEDYYKILLSNKS